MTRLPHEIPATGPAADFAAHLAAELPVIETARLRLRAPRIEDFQAYAEIATGPSGHFLTENPDREGAWLDFAQMTATWLLRGHGIWSVETRDTGDLAGFVVLGFEPGDHEPELGYMFREVATGKGYATEAAQAARDYAFGTLDMTTLVSTIDHENAASHRVAERLDGKRDAAAETAHNNEIRVYRHTRMEALA